MLMKLNFDFNTVVFIIIQVGIAGDTEKENFGVRPVDVDVFVDPEGADDVSAERSNVLNEFAAL